MIRRAWSMPNRHTFDMPPVREFISRHRKGELWLDPFAARRSPGCVSNDLNPDADTDHHEDALDFLRRFSGVDGILFDPPYSPRQIKECYEGIGMEVHRAEVQSSFYGKRKDAAARAIKPGGMCLSFGWNSNGMGVGRGFELVEMLVVAHGGAHNDTICVAERKTSNLFENNGA